MRIKFLEGIRERKNASDPNYHFISIPVQITHVLFDFFDLSNHWIPMITITSNFIPLVITNDLFLQHPLISSILYYRLLSPTPEQG